MKQLTLVLLLVATAATGYSQSVSAEQVKNNFSKTWKSNYVLMNGMRIDSKAGIPMMIFEVKTDNTLQAYASNEPSNKMQGSWKYLADKKQIQIKVLGAERGFVTALANDEMSVSLNTNQMGGADGSEMIMVLAPVN